MSAKKTVTAVLKAERRSGKGSRDASRARRDGKVPVNVYGHGEANEHLLTDAHALDLALKTEQQVFTLDVEGKEESCLVREVQYDTFGLHVLHVDFARVDLKEEVEVEVPIEIAGQAKGVNDGGTLVTQHPAIWVKCRADSIPAHIEVDVTEVEMGHAIHAGEVTLPKGVKLDEQKMDPETAIVGVVAPKAEVEETPAEGEVPEGEAPAEGEAPSGEAPEGGEASDDAPEKKDDE